jgi:hypothetical protein
VFVVSCTDYFIAGAQVVLNKSIDREDTDLFPDQSNTYIILHLEVSCGSDEETIYEFWDKRYLTSVCFTVVIQFVPLHNLKANTFSAMSWRQQQNDDKPYSAGIV